MLAQLQASLGSPLMLIYVAGLAISGAGIVGELCVTTLLRKPIYRAKDTVANLAMYAGHFALDFVWVHGQFTAYAWASRHAVAHVVIGGWHVGQYGLAWEWVLLVVLEDFCFYWYHRASHRVRVLWASHVTHHSSRTYNLSVAFRQSWIPFLGIVFWLPLPLIGFDPIMVMTAQVVSLAYQALLHTQLVPSLGPIGWIFNTPAHHAIHHGSNVDYLDKNYGGIFIIWDRLFGTFARRREPIQFGLTHDLRSHNPIVIATHEWYAMLRDIWRRPFTGKLAAVLAPPRAPE